MPYKYDPCVTCCGCNPATTKIGVTINNTFGGIVDFTELTVTIIYDGNPVASSAMEADGTIEFSVTKRGVYTVILSRLGQSVSKTVTINNACSSSGTSFQLMGVTINGCIDGLPDVEVDITGQTSISLTASSNGVAWWIYNGVGTYNLSATYTGYLSSRFQTLVASIVSNNINPRYSSIYSLPAVSGYACFYRACQSSPGGTTTYLPICSYPLPTTLSGTVFGVTVSFVTVYTSVSGVSLAVGYVGCFNKTALSEGWFISEPPDLECLFNYNVCSPNCADGSFGLKTCAMSSTGRVNGIPLYCSIGGRLPYQVPGINDIHITVSLSPISKPFCLDTIYWGVSCSFLNCCTADICPGNIFTGGGNNAGGITFDIVLSSPCAPLEIEGSAPSTPYGDTCVYGGDALIIITE